MNRNIMQIVLVLKQKCWSSPKALIGRACAAPQHAAWLRRNAAVTPAVPVAAAKLAPCWRIGPTPRLGEQLQALTSAGRCAVVNSFIQHCCVFVRIVCGFGVSVYML